MGHIYRYNYVAAPDRRPYLPSREEKEQRTAESAHATAEASATRYKRKGNIFDSGLGAASRNG